jgi:hypothetical protein
VPAELIDHRIDLAAHRRVFGRDGTRPDSHGLHGWRGGPDELAQTLKGLVGCRRGRRLGGHEQTVADLGVTRTQTRQGFARSLIGRPELSQPTGSLDQSFGLNGSWSTLFAVRPLPREVAPLVISTPAPYLTLECLECVDQLKRLGQLLGDIGKLVVQNAVRAFLRGG